MPMPLSTMLPEELKQLQEKLFPLGFSSYLDFILYEDMAFFKRGITGEETEEEIDEYEESLPDSYPFSPRFGFYIRARIIKELGLSIPLLFGTELVIGGGRLQLEGDFDSETGQFKITLSADVFKLRFGRDLLKPVIKKEIINPNDPSGNNKITVYEADPDENNKIELSFPVSISVDDQGSFDVDWESSVTDGLSLPPSMLGDTGIVIEGNLMFDFSRTSALQDAPGPAADPEWVGIIINNLAVYLPQDMCGILPGEISAKMIIGSSGISGMIKGSWVDLNGNPLAVLKKEVQADQSIKQYYEGPGRFSLFGMCAACREIELVFEDSMPVNCSVEGQFILPYFDVPVDVGLGIGLDGKISFEIRGVGEDGDLIRLKKEDLFELALKSLEVNISREKFEVCISGLVKPLILGLSMPEFEVKELRIDSKGNVSIEGGWLDLSEAKKLDFYGFTLELSKLGFGTDKDTGRRWIGINGAVNLPIAAGASVEGLRISWDPREANPIPSVTLDGVGAKLAIAGVFSFEGFVSFFDDKDRGSKGFRGSIKLSLDSLGFTINGEIVIGRSRHGYTFFYIYVSVDLPAGIPLFTTGAGIYGFQGLLAINMEPNRKPDEAWYDGWYKRTPVGATGGAKWWDVDGSFALGAGIAIGTQSDNGFSINAKALLILVLPGPIIMLEGKANFVKTRPSSSDVTMDGSFTALIVLDCRQGILQMNFEANFNLVKVLKAYAGVEVFFDFNNASNWHLFLGMKEPENKRIGVDLLSLFKANGYYMMWNDRLEVGAWFGYKGGPWEFGPLKAKLEAWMCGEGLISRNPAHLEGTFQLYGALELSAFGFGISITADAKIEGRGPTPWEFNAYLEASLKINLLFKKVTLSAKVSIHYEEEAEPVPVPPLAGISAEHLYTDASWELMEGNDTLSQIPENAPVIPPDALPILIFNRPVFDDACAGLATVAEPQPDVIGKDGKHEFRYRLKQVEILQSQNGSWKGISAVCSLADSLKNTDTSNLQLSHPLEAFSSFSGGKVEVRGSVEVGESVEAGVSTQSILNASAQSVESENPVHISDQKPSCAVINGTPKTTGQILSVEDKLDGTFRLTVNFDSPAASDAYAGGILKCAGIDQEYMVVSNTASTLDLWTEGDMAPPAAEAFTISGAAGERIYGQWLPTGREKPFGKPDEEHCVTDNNKLQLWTKNPFTYFRRNDEDILKPDSFFVTGPKVEEIPAEAYFDKLQGILQTGNYPVDLFTMTVFNDNEVTVVNNGEHKALRLSCNTPLNIEFANMVRNMEQVLIQLVKLYGCGSFSVSADWDKDGIWQEIHNRGFLFGTALTIDVRSEGGSLKNIKIHPEDKQGSRMVSHIAYLPGWIRVEIPGGLPVPNGGEASIAGITLSMTSELKETLNLILKLIQTYKGKLLIMKPVNALSVLINNIYKLISDILARFPSTKAKIDQLCLLIEKLIQKGKPRIIFPRPGEQTGILSEADIKRLRGILSKLRSAGIIKIKLKEPVTRVRLLLSDLNGAVLQAAAFGANTEYASAFVTAASGMNELTLNAADKEYGFIDRIEVAGMYPFIREIWYDSPEFAWNIIDQYEAYQTVKQQMEYMYRQDYVFTPASEYCIRVIVDTTDKDKLVNTTCRHYYFKTGMPPMGTQPDSVSSPSIELTDLTKYVAGTVPVNGAGEKGMPLHYRGYDIDVLFNNNYVYSLYYKAKYSLKLAVKDNNGIKLSDVRIYPGESYYNVYSEIDKVWIATLDMDQTKDVVQVDWNEVPGNGRITAIGKGNPLRPNELHKLELYAQAMDGSGCSGILKYFEFTTSGYINFSHHIQSYKDILWKVTPDLSAGVLSQADSTLSRFFSVDALILRDIQHRLIVNREQGKQPEFLETCNEMRLKTAEMFDEFAGLTGLVKTSVRNTELSLINCGSQLLLLEAFEPLNWRRTCIAVKKAAVPVAAFDQKLSPKAAVKVTAAAFGEIADDYYIEFTALEDTELKGYCVEAAKDSAELNFGVYYRFSQHYLLMAGRKVRIAAPASVFGKEDGIDLINQDMSKINAGEQLALPAGTAWIQISDASGAVMQRKVTADYTSLAELNLGENAAESFLLIPNLDGSRNLLLMKGSDGKITVEKGIYCIRFEYYRNIGPVDEVQKENNIMTPETTEITFICN